MWRRVPDTTKVRSAFDWQPGANLDEVVMDFVYHELRPMNEAVSAAVSPPSYDP